MHHHSLFIIYVMWAAIIGTVFVVLVLLATMLPFGKSNKINYDD